MTVYVRRDKVAASREEQEYAILEGVNFEYMKSPVRITDEGVILADTQFNEEGKLVVIEGTEHLVPCDTVMVAISQVPQHRLVTRDPSLKLNERGNLEVHENGQTTMPGVFASGDVVTGAKTVVHAVAESKLIAQQMDRYMQSL